MPPGPAGRPGRGNENAPYIMFPSHRGRPTGPGGRPVDWFLIDFVHISLVQCIIRILLVLVLVFAVPKTRPGRRANLSNLINELDVNRNIGDGTIGIVLAAQLV